MRQPTWEEMHTVLPWWYCISTVSMQLPSDSSHRYLMVPSSRDSCLRATTGAVIKHRPFSFSRRDLERLVISSKEAAPRCSHVKTCLARNAGSPSSFRNWESSCWVMDLISVIKAPRSFSAHPADIKAVRAVPLRPQRQLSAAAADGPRQGKRFQCKFRVRVQKRRGDAPHFPPAAPCRWSRAARRPAARRWPRCPKWRPEWPAAPPAPWGPCSGYPASCG